MIPLSKAFLCADFDCQTIGDNSRECARCGSISLLKIESVLNRTDAGAAKDLRELEKIFKLQ